MGRTARDKRESPHPGPVHKIELSEKHFALRVVLMLILFLLGIGGIGYAMKELLSTPAGWTIIETEKGSFADGAEEFIFRYLLGGNGLNATLERKRVTKCYSAAMRRAYELFQADEEVEGIYNLAYINSHAGEEIQLEEALWQALEIALQDRGRAIYLGPVYNCYASIFHSTQDWEAQEVDPVRNRELAEECRKYISYVNDPGQIELRLLEDNRVELVVSPEFRKYVEGNWEERYLDFGWMKNAFVVDYVAGQLTEEGYTEGILISGDGFCRDLRENREEQSYRIQEEQGQESTEEKRLTYRGPLSLISLNNFPALNTDIQRFYQYEDGDLRGPYVNPGNGLSKSEPDTLVIWSGEASCSRLLLEFYDCFFDEESSAEKELEEKSEKMRREADGAWIGYFLRTESGCVTNDPDLKDMANNRKSQQ